jgi:hypothetical protein
VSGILLGYEIGSGKEVLIPVRHMCVTGQTQESGKTTTLEALISRSEKRAIAFVTKRGERSFESGRKILPYFKERADWEFVESVVEAIMRQRMKFERAWIVRACKGAGSLDDVHRNVMKLMVSSKRSMDQDIYMLLGEYLLKVLPLLARLPKADEIRLERGLNVMDLRSYPEELQMLIISSSMRWVHQEENEVITILPEAWKFAPQGRNTPVKLEVRKIAREGAGLKNYIWVDSQDIAGVEKEILRAASVWLIGVQREANEIERALSSIPKGIKRPKEGDIPQLKLGQFFACWGEHVRKTYVMPTWMTGREAIQIARGEMCVSDVAPPPHAEEEEDNLDYKAAYEEAQETIRTLEARLAKLEAKPQGQPVPAPIGRTVQGMPPAPDAETPIMKLEKKIPEIDLTIRRYTIQADDSTLVGRMALLLTEGFFDRAKGNQDVVTELARRGKTTMAPRVSEAFAKLADYGFLTKEAEGYLSVPGMKVRVKEVEAVA